MHSILDFDGTLADSKQCSILATQTASKKIKLSIPSEDQISYYMGIPIEKSFKQMASIFLNNEEFDQLIVSFRALYKVLKMTRYNSSRK